MQNRKEGMGWDGYGIIRIVVSVRSLEGDVYMENEDGEWNWEGNDGLFTCINRPLTPGQGDVKFEGEPFFGTV